MILVAGSLAGILFGILIESGMLDPLIKVGLRRESELILARRPK
jgi:hypothetical protein